MRTLRFHFFRNPGIGTELICARLGTAFSHIATEFEDGAVYHSTFLHGNVKTTMVEMQHKPLYSTEIVVPDAWYKEAQEYGESIVGKKYDYRAIVGFVIGRKWENHDALFCSELGCILFETATRVCVPKFTLTSPETLQVMVDVYRRAQFLNK